MTVFQIVYAGVWEQMWRRIAKGPRYPDPDLTPLWNPTSVLAYSWYFRAVTVIKEKTPPQPDFWLPTRGPRCLPGVPSVI